jgi:hypothetical protein
VKYIKNNSGGDDTWLGQLIVDQEYYLIQSSEDLSFSNNSKVLSDIGSGNLLVAKDDSGSNDILEVSDAINYLKNVEVGTFDNEGHALVSTRKSYATPSKSFSTPDYSNRDTWFSDYTRVVDEVMSTSDDTTYTSIRTPTTGWNHHWMDWSKIPNHARQDNGSNLKTILKKNDVVITSGFSIDCTNGQVVFESANSPSDVIKATYSYGNSSKFDLVANSGKKLNLDYVEVQFSEGSVMPEGEYLLFQSIYNGPAIPANALGAGHPGLPANTDIVLRTFEYHGYHDFLNESTLAISCKKFMGLTKEVVILPWNYLTGHTIKPVGEVADLSLGEFHKLRCCMAKDGVIQDCEIATGTFYCIIESL